MEASDSPGRRDRQVAILERHLPEGYSADAEASLATEAEAAGPADTSSPSQAATAPNSSSTPESIMTDEGEALESSLKLQGGDIHRDMFRVKAKAGSARRSKTFSHRPSSSLPDLPALALVQDDANTHAQQRPRLQRHHRRHSGPLIVGEGFLNFIGIYGNFAGEALEDTDSEDESAVESPARASPPFPPHERRPLLAPRIRRPRSSIRPRQGDAGPIKTFFTLLKAFIGTGILFLPKAFRNGGLVFSLVTLAAVSLVSSFCFHLLLSCHTTHGGGYGELGATIIGPRFRSLILASIALSQLGFVCSGIIFTAENLSSLLSLSHLSPGVPALILLQLVPLVPLALIRNISRLGPAALLADCFILVGLVYIYAYDAAALSARGLHPSVRLFNGSDFALTMGSAIFTFEGIGLILPIQASMRRPNRFPALLAAVMALITALFASVGALCYATFGDDTRIQVLSNFPQRSPVLAAVRFLYTMAVLVGEPVQLFPAVRILETTIFGERATGKRSLAIKWKKNALRTIAIACCAAVALVGASDLDKFVALIGGFACVPLVYIYPAYLHYHGVAQTSSAKALDLATMVLGGVVMVFTTSVAVVQWARGT